MGTSRPLAFKELYWKTKAGTKNPVDVCMKWNPNPDEPWFDFENQNKFFAQHLQLDIPESYSNVWILTLFWQ